MRCDEVADLLPEVLRREVAAGDASPIAVLVAAMAELQGSVEASRSSITQVVDAYACSDRFVPMLASWVQLDRIFDREHALACDPREHRSSCDLARARELIAQAASCAKLRGTATGLRRMLVLATGCQAVMVDEVVPGPDGEPLPFHIRVRLPADQARHRGLVERIVCSEKPAYTTHEVRFGDEQEAAA